MKDEPVRVLHREAQARECGCPLNVRHSCPKIAGPLPAGTGAGGAAVPHAGSDRRDRRRCSASGILTIRDALPTRGAVRLDGTAEGLAEYRLSIRRHPVCLEAAWNVGESKPN